MYFGGYLADVLDVALLHGEDEVRLVQHLTIDLPGTVMYVFQPVLVKHLMCGLVHWVAY